VEVLVNSNLEGDMDILRRSMDRLKAYGEHIEDHTVVTMSLHLLDNLERLRINFIYYETLEKIKNER